MGPALYPSQNPNEQNGAKRGFKWIGFASLVIQYDEMPAVDGWSH